MISDKELGDMLRLLVTTRRTINEVTKTVLEAGHTCPIITLPPRINEAINVLARETEERRLARKQPKEEQS